MSGALAAIAGAGNKLAVSVTVGDINDAVGNTYGFSTAASASAGLNAANAGSLSISTVKGVNIILITSFFGSKFRLALAGTLARTFFQSLTIQDTAGNIVYLKQQDAAFDAATYAGATLWEWSSITGWTGTGTRFVLVSY